jgi:hypothetical protein
VRLRDAGDRGRDEQHTGEQEDRAESVHACHTTPRVRASQRTAPEPLGRGRRPGPVFRNDR